ncbi:hypothetical protein Pint_01982 [Pistacia integerrima]|uniref:Uncharacterized protein n=1 Tax=Pistacia integerrima TaxID=434235 RepID=A0ACC0ZNE0_9ROSI|nr:hypothetical protein Pint_01982 [Pistacia integerrima]
MSFLAGGRLAGKEGAFFFQESKQAVNRIVEKTTTNTKNVASPASSSPSLGEQEFKADVLPEVLRHCLPSKIFGRPSDPSSLSTGSKWVLPIDPNASSVSPDALNPLRAYLSLPQVTFGPKRYTPHVNPEKLEAAAEGLHQIGKAFAVATVIIFGGATAIFGMTACKLDAHNVSVSFSVFICIPFISVEVKSETDELRTKARDLVQPKFDIIREQLTPIKTWAENTQKKWHLENQEDFKEKPIIKELSRILGAKNT